MKFHEDIIFKDSTNDLPQSILEIMHVEGKVIRILPTEYAIIDPKMYKPDIVLELKDKIIILEFQSTYVDINDKKRFRFYSSLVDSKKNKFNKPVEVHVLSTVEKEQIKFYKVNEIEQFPMFIHSLKEYDYNKFINGIKYKINNNEKIEDTQLMLLGFSPFMKAEKEIEKLIEKTSKIITDLTSIEYGTCQFLRSIEIIITDKFVKNDFKRRSIINLLGGNMKIIEEYAEDYAKQKLEEQKEEMKQKVTEEVKHELTEKLKHEFTVNEEEIKQKVFNDIIKKLVQLNIDNQIINNVLEMQEVL